MDDRRVDEEVFEAHVVLFTVGRIFRLLNVLVHDFGALARWTWQAIHLHTHHTAFVGELSRRMRRETRHLEIAGDTTQPSEIFVRRVCRNGYRVLYRP